MTYSLLLTGYDNHTEVIRFKSKIQNLSEAELLQLLNLPSDEDFYGVYLIPSGSLTELATYAEQTPVRDDLEYFVETYDPN